jgi:hypothetical protein
MDYLRVLSHNSLSTREISSLFNKAEFEIYENYLHLFRLQVFGAYQEDNVRSKKFLFVVEHSGKIELKSGGQNITSNFSEGDLIVIEKGFKYRVIGNPVTLLVIEYDV